MFLNDWTMGWVAGNMVFSGAQVLFNHGGDEGVIEWCSSGVRLSLLAGYCPD